MEDGVTIRTPPIWISSPDSPATCFLVLGQLVRTSITPAWQEVCGVGEEKHLGLFPLPPQLPTPQAGWAAGMEVPWEEE